MSIVFVALFAMLFVYVIVYGFYHGVVRRNIPGYYSARRLHGVDARRHGWVMVAIGLYCLLMLAVLVLIVRSAG
jgi:hypothetical protein